MKKTIKRILALVIIFTLSLTLLLGTSTALAGDEPGESAGEGRHWEKQLVEAAHDVLICDKEPHTHDDDCYSLTCEEHVHDDDCYSTNTIEHVCKGTHPNNKTSHTHTYTYPGRSCTKKDDNKWYYTTTETVLTCGFDSDHTHSDIPGDCYMLTCDYEEEHTHGPDCYEHVEDRYEWVSVRDKGTVELTVTYSDSNNAVKNKEVTLTDVDGNEHDAFTDDSGIAVFTGVNTGAVTFASISYTSSNRTYTGTPAGVTLLADGDTVQAAVNLALILTGKADHVDLRMQNASITVNTSIVEASDHGNIISTTTNTTTGSVIGITSAVITWNDDTPARTITGFEPREGYDDYEYTKGFNRDRDKIKNIQNIESVVFTINLKDADDNEYDNVVVSYDQAGVQFAAINCDGYRDGKISGLDFDVETVTNLIIEKTIPTNKVIKVTKVWDDKGQELDHPPVDITVTQTCGETEVSDTKTLDSSSDELLFGFFELEDNEYTYTVSEAPVSGYSMSDGTVTPVDPEGDLNYQYEATLTNTYVLSEYPFFTIEKVDGNVKLITSSPARFTLYNDDGLTNVFGTYTTSDGTARVDGLAPGTYFLKETKAPTGYNGDSTVWMVIVEEYSEPMLTVNQVETSPYSIRVLDSHEENALKNGILTVVNTLIPTPPPPPPSQPTSQFGTLTVDKTVTGANASATEKFTFTVTFSGNTSGIANNAGLSGSGGVYTFSLSANAVPVTFTNIPLNTSYTVTEALTADQSDGGWTASTASNGTISNTTPVTVTIENAYAAGVLEEYDVEEGEDEESSIQGDSITGTLPQTGGISLSTLLGIFGLALIVIGGTAFMLLRKKKNHGESH